MTTSPSQAETDSLEALDLDLFCLELEYQVQTRLKTDIKRVLDERDAKFQATLAAHPASIAERERHQREQADYRRRKERRAYIESGAAAQAAQEEEARSRPPLKELAAQLAQHWNVPMIGHPSPDA